MTVSSAQAYWEAFLLHPSKQIFKQIFHASRWKDFSKLIKIICENSLGSESPTIQNPMLLRSVLFFGVGDAGNG